MCLLPSLGQFEFIMSKCGQGRNLTRGPQIYNFMMRYGLISHSELGSHLVTILVRLKSMTRAWKAFQEGSLKTKALMDCVINGYIKCGDSRGALDAYQTMVDDSFYPTEFTLVALLKTCTKLKNLEKGSDIHAKVVDLGLLKRNLFIGNTLIDMYGKCGSLLRAQEVFDQITVPDVVSWNALIAGYAKHDCGEKALSCFRKMQVGDISPDAVTFTCILKACSSIRASSQGIEIHSEIARKGLLERDVVLGGALVDMYVKCGLLSYAEEVFNCLHVRDVVSWTTLIMGYAQSDSCEEALRCFEAMSHHGVYPNAMTLATILKACGHLGTADKGEEIHNEILKNNWFGNDLVLGTALVDMYAKCGLVTRSHSVFETLSYKDVVLWNSLLSGYTQLGDIGKVIILLNKMKEITEPDEVTFVSVLNACSHTGLLDWSHVIFKAMLADYGINPILEHQMCLVDLFGRTGWLEGVVLLLNNSPFHPNIMMWRTLLGACRKWGNVDLGRKAFKEAIQLGEKEAATYVCMYNIYADAGLDNDARHLGELRMDVEMTLVDLCRW